MTAVDAVIVHSEYGRRQLVDELEVDPDKVHVIHHGAFAPARQTRRVRSRASLRTCEEPVVLFFGLLRPYKGLESLLEAWRGIDGAELWIVGRPRMPIEPLQEIATDSGPVRLDVRRRRRAAGLLPPRRRGRAALLADRAVRSVGRAGDRARVRQAGRADRRRRLLRSRRDRRRVARAARRSGGAARGAAAADRRSRRPRSDSPRRPQPRPPARTRGSRPRRQTAGAIPHNPRPIELS